METEIQETKTVFSTEIKTKVMSMEVPMVMLIMEIRMETPMVTIIKEMPMAMEMVTKTKGT